MIEEALNLPQSEFLLKLVISLIVGFFIGVEREWRGKPAGISTHALVIGGSMIFTYLSLIIDPNEPARIAAQIITGIGFLGAGIILVKEDHKIENVTTAASIWFSASIGMALGFGMYFVAVVAALYALLVPRIPHFGNRRNQ